MPYPESTRLELPILQELKATGGRDQPRYLYDRLTRYFPQLTAQELAEKTEAGRHRWHRVVQRTAKQLLENGEVRRQGSAWEITAKGVLRVEGESLQIMPVGARPRSAHTNGESSGGATDASRNWWHVGALCCCGI